MHDYVIHERFDWMKQILKGGVHFLHFPGSISSSTTAHPKIRGQLEVVLLDHHWREVCQRIKTPHLIYLSMN